MGDLGRIGKEQKFCFLLPLTFSGVDHVYVTGQLDTKCKQLDSGPTDASIHCKLESFTEAHSDMWQTELITFSQRGKNG